jgi:hypothetical protein
MSPCNLKGIKARHLGPSYWLKGKWILLDCPHAKNTPLIQCWTHLYLKNNRWVKMDKMDFDT